MIARLSHGDFKRLAGSFTRFSMVGAVVTALNYALFLIQLHFGVPYMTALIIGWVICVVISFLLNRRLTFLVSGSGSAREMSGYIMASLFQLALALAGYVVLIDGLSIPPAVAYPINLVVVSVSNFVILRFLVYPLRQMRAATIV